jgi:hypothetical protein
MNKTTKIVLLSTGAIALVLGGLYAYGVYKEKKEQKILKESVDKIVEEYEVFN